VLDQRRHHVRIVFWAFVAVTLLVIFGVDVFIGDGSGRVDLIVYHDGVQSWLTGHGLYDYSLLTFDGLILPFTYPPFAALILVPLAELPLTVAFGAWDVIQASVALLLVWLTVNRANGRRLPSGWSGAALLAGAWALFMLHGPVLHDFLLGQISLIVIGLVVVDFTLVPVRFRGLLTGVAGALKLLPLAYLPYFLITRQWRAAANLLGGFVGATGLAFLIMPRESWLYWTDLLFQTQRVGDLDTLRNKSLLGVLVRWDIGGPAQRWIWLLLVAGIAAVALWRAWQHHQRGEEFAAMLVVGLLTSIANPITWNHHLIWLSLTMLYLATTGRRVWQAVAAVIYFALWGWSPLMWPDNSGPMWLQIGVAAIPLAMTVLVCRGLPPVASTTGLSSAVSRPATEVD
jgi:alpha-1,2-mannosyltransferase